MNVLEKALLKYIYIPADFPEKTWFVGRMAPQRSSEVRECTGVELVGGQVREDDDFYTRVLRSNG